MLYLVATPIGNLKDISSRALDVIQKSDYALCEDTRHTKTLLLHYSIDVPLRSYHKFNEASREEEVIADLSIGKDIALVSDAGMPGIADPGMRIVQKCIENDIKITVIPGPTAAITAVVLSGFETTHFQFFGFLPKKKSHVVQAFEAVMRFPGVSIWYESPKRIHSTIKALAACMPMRRVVIARELTKKFEECIRGTAQQVEEMISQREIKGEIVLILEGAEEEERDHDEMKEKVVMLREQLGFSHKDAVKAVSLLFNVPKNSLY
jgi:16S rRNA (cytidine1402-2'-O)-methyltransferase